MQIRTLILILSIGAFAAFSGCERHDWENTRVLHQGHGGDHGEKHDDGHHDKDNHSKDKDSDHGKGDEKEHAKTGEEKAHAKPEREEKEKSEPRKL